MLSEKIGRNEACCHLEIVVMVLTLSLPEKQGFYQFSNTSNLIICYIKIKSYAIFKKYRSMAIRKSNYILAF